MTPEIIAQYIAKRVNLAFGHNNATVLDGFAGCGGNVIQFARLCGAALGVDIDPVKIQYLIHNSEIYECSEKVYCTQADFLKFKASDFSGYNIDAVFMSPPWGGVGYESF